MFVKAILAIDGVREIKGRYTTLGRLHRIFMLIRDIDTISQKKFREGIELIKRYGISNR